MDEDDLMWVKKIKKNCHVLVNQFHGNFRSKTIGSRKIKLFSGMQNGLIMFVWTVTELNPSVHAEINSSFTFTTLKYFCINHEDQRVLSIRRVQYVNIYISAHISWVQTIDF